MKYKTYTFRAYPNKTQQKKMELTFVMCRLMFNKLLIYENNNYKTYKNEVDECSKNNANFDSKEFNKTHKMPKISLLKKSDERFKEVDSLALCAEYSNLVRGMILFYKGLSKKPKLKGDKDKDSYTTSQVNDNIRIEGRKVRLPKIGMVKVRGMRAIPNYFKIKRAHVLKNRQGKFYISVVFEYDEKFEEVESKEIPENNEVNEENVVGLDFKIGDIFVSSDDFTPKYSANYAKALDKIPKCQKEVNRKVKFSKNYWKATNKLRKAHRKAVNIRKDTQHKISSKLAKVYDYVVIENLSIKEIVKKLGRGKNAYNTSFCAFVKRLLYKVKGKIIKINKWFPSSKKCSCCGKKKKHLRLSQRVYRCAFCGNVIDRDLNAAINIRNEGMRILTLT